MDSRLIRKTTLSVIFRLDGAERVCNFDLALFVNAIIGVILIKM